MAKEHAEDMTLRLEQAIDEAVTVDLPLGVERRNGRAASHYPMTALKAAHSANRTALQRLADYPIRAASSATFLALHAVWFCLWIVWNTGTFGLPIIDPFPFGL